MHQPCYLDGATGESVLPWVRLHATKAYLDMAEAMSRAPDGVRCTVNFTPVLLDQLERYGRSEVKDPFLAISTKPAEHLEPEEVRFVLRWFFMANWDTMVKPRSRYWSLLTKRGLDRATWDLDEAARRFSAEDLRDLQVWFNLAWFGWAATRRYPVVGEMIAKGARFTEEDKAAIMGAQLECVRAVVPAWRALLEAGRVELSATPFYHPILPLLVNTRHARRAVPDLALPEDFAAPEHADLQVQRAAAFHQRTWGRAPRGMWPAEGSVSPEVVPLFRKHGIAWIASDEDVLHGSLGRRNREADLYRPWRASQGGQEIAVFFRDRVLSDLIGFTYSKMEPDAAAADFLGRLRQIASTAEGDRPCASVILDGENPWEYYPDGGERFLDALYRGLGDDPQLSGATFESVLEGRGGAAALDPLPQLHSGSWIQANYRIWIGQPEENAAWTLLKRAREDVLARLSGPHPPAPEGAAAAVENLLRAEGSDWFWWYDDDFNSDNDVQFDLLFRTHVANAYRAAGLEPPPAVSHPITKAALGVVHNTRPPTAFVHPAIDGRAERFYEWTGAGYYAVGKAEGTMHKGTAWFVGIYYGFDLENLYFRLDPVTRLVRNEPEEELNLLLTLQVPDGAEREPREYRIVFPLKRGVSAYSLGGPRTDAIDDTTSSRVDLLRGLSPVRERTAIAYDRLVELAIPLADLGLQAGSHLDFTVRVLVAQTEIDRYPRNGTVRVDVPTPDFERLNWWV